MFLKDILKQPACYTLLRVTCFFWLIAKLVGWKVWLSYRLFPLVPPVEALQAPAIIHLLLFVFSLVCIISIIVFPRIKFLLLLLLFVELFSCALDQTRWQPWEYQYLFTLLIFIIYKNNTKSIFPSIACILIATYFYSAINKFNNGFLSGVWDSLILRHYLKLGNVHIANQTLHYAGYVLPVIELTGCIGLLFPSTKKIAVYTLTAMHVFNLIVFGPFGLQYNKIVWPWNVAMIITLWMIFLKQEMSFNLIWKNTNRLVAFCWLLLPALSFVGLWDNYLSCNLYSGNLPLMTICVQNNIDSIDVGKYFSKRNSPGICNEGNTLNIQNWALAEMNIPPYPEERVYQAIKKDWLKKYPSLHTTFYVKHRVILKSPQMKKLFTGANQYEEMQ